MDVAALALNIDSSKVLQAANDLDKFAAAATRAGSATGNPNGSIAKLAATVASADAKLSVIIGTLEKIASSMAGAGTAAKAANNNIGDLSGKMTALQGPASQLAATMGKMSVNFGMVAPASKSAAASIDSVGRAAMQADAHVAAYRAHLASLPPVLDTVPTSTNKVRAGVEGIGTSLKLTARDGLNFSRQFADIGVTAAMGMNPLMIALQQGPQLFDILQEKAIATGTSIGATFRAVGAQALSALAPFLPLIAILGVAAAALAALTAQANDDSGLKKYTTAMGYTKEEVAKLNAVTVTFGDTFKAVFQVGFERVADAFGTSAKGIAAIWDRVMNALITAARATVAGLYALFAGLGYAVKRVYDNMKAGKFENPLTSLVEGGKSAYGDAQGFMDDVVKRARGNARRRQDAMAAGMYDKPGGGAKGGKSDAEKLADILRDAQQQIDAENRRAQAVGLTAIAAAEAEQKFKLLDQVQKAGLKVTPALTKEIERLAAAYAKAKIDADISVALENSTDAIQKQRDAIADQTKLVGLYGDALARAKRELEAQRALQNSLPKGEIVVAPNLTGGLSDDADALAKAERMEKVRKDAEDSMYAMKLEAAGMGLTGASALAWAQAQEQLNAAKRAGIELGPAEIRQIQEAAEAYGNARYSIDQQAKAIADAREVTKGFFSDWINGVREGGNIFKTFADSVVGALNRIIDKLLDRTLNGFLDSMFSGGSGGGIFGSIFGGKSSSKSIFDSPGGKWSIDESGAIAHAKGAAFDRAMRFAKGGAFTNTIVTTPTLFRFANGGKMGEMGEAGPEAIMPLKRGPNGSLGVEMHGGGRSVVKMGDVHNSFSFAGAVGLDGIAAMVRQGGEATYNQVKRDLETLLQQLDTDGAFAS